MIVEYHAKECGLSALGTRSLPRTSDIRKLSHWVYLELQGGQERKRLGGVYFTLKQHAMSLSYHPL